MTDAPAAADRFVVRATLAPLNEEPRVSSPLASQLLHGEVVRLVDGRGDWLQVRGPDHYLGWVHVGYLRPASGDEAAWRLSLGCTVRQAERSPRVLPFGARVPLEATVLGGEALSAADQAARFRRVGTHIGQSAVQWFAGAPYVWGGVSPWGVDCSGLVQRVFALHGVSLPRDAWQQAEAVAMAPNAPPEARPADLLFFSDRDDRRVTHVGLALGDGYMVHSALARGGVSVENMQSDEPYVRRLRAQWMGTGRIAVD